MGTTTPNPRSQRILVAEDDVGLREVLIETLAAEGHDVVAVGSAQAIERTLLGRSGGAGPGFDLLVTDLRMPGASTLDVLERLGGCGLRPPTLLLSAFTDDATLVEAYRIGILCALAKPFDLRDLVRLVELLSIPRPGGAP